MVTAAGIQAFVLRELRLRDTAPAGEAARAVAEAAGATGPAVPLLTSIDDERDVAVLRAVYAGETAETEDAQRDALEAFVVTWRPPQRYAARIAERSGTSPSYYRLAVTGSGINNADPDRTASAPGDADGSATPTPLELLWVGAPLGTHAGLLVLLGTAGDDERPDAQEWPLPLSRELGVRIYDSRP